MKRYGFIVNKQFTVNRKRNISTILGIILSIILFTTVGYLQVYQKQININESIYRNGDYEARFVDISQDEVDKLRNNIYVKDIFLYSNKNSEKITVDNIEKYIYVYEFDEAALDRICKPFIQLEKGSFPINDTEVIIEEISAETLKKEVGDEITVGDKAYDIVGIYKSNSEFDNYNIELISFMNNDSSKNTVNVLFNVNKEKNKIETINKIASDIGLPRDDSNIDLSSIFNNNLMYSYGEFPGSNMELVEYIMYIAILLLTSGITYGAINISIKERIEQFSILRCIGATPSKIRMLLVKESAMLTIFSLVPGIIIAQFICYFMSHIIMEKVAGVNTYGVGYTLYPDLIVKVIILTIMNIVIANIVPLIKIGKISPIEGVATAGNTQKVSRKKNTKIIKKLFGYNGELAYKNIRGNNKNFIITTIISIIILTIFIVFTGYNNNVIASYNREMDISKDMVLDINNHIDKVDIYEDIYRLKDEVESLKITEKILPRVTYNMNGIFEDVTFNKWVKEEAYGNNSGQIKLKVDGKDSIYSSDINLVVMEDETLEELIDIHNLDLTVDQFNNNGALVLDRRVLKNYILVDRVPLFNLEKGEKFKLSIGEIDSNKSNNSMEEDIEAVKVNNEQVTFEYLGSINGREVFDGNRYGYDMNITLIVSKAFYNNNKVLFTEINSQGERYIKSPYGNIVIDIRKDIDINEASTIIKNYANKNKLNYYDAKYSAANIKNDVEVISGIGYMILFLMMIVGAVNIINNKFISIKLRGKELGTLLAIGISKKRLRKILILEAIVQWLISSVISIGLSMVILKVLEQILMYSFDVVKYKTPILAMIFSVVLLLVINCIGTYLPLRQLKYIDTTELIRNDE